MGRMIAVIAVAAMMAVSAPIVATASPVPSAAAAPGKATPTGTKPPATAMHPLSSAGTAALQRAVNVAINKPAARARAGRSASRAQALAPSALPGGNCTTSGTAPNQTESCTFGGTGSNQTFTVPVGVSSITADLYGAQGGSNSTSGGNGGELETSIAVSAGQVYNIAVGTQGGSNTTAGYPDGGTGGSGATGNGGDNGCGGGGGTRLSLVGQIAEAGGGGGCAGSGYNGNHGAGTGGSGGNLVNGTAGGGTSGGSDGCGPFDSADPGQGGGGASAAANGGGGGSGGRCNLVGSNANGGGGGSGNSGGGGGRGSNAEIDGGGSGGGGGGGWKGGGGGGGGGQYGAGGGGGGGGSNGGGGSVLGSFGNVRSGAGLAVISYPLLPTATTLAITPSQQTVGGAITVQAHVTSTNTGVPATTGTVAFSGLSGLCASATVDANGNATCAFTPTTVGTFAVVASYAAAGAYGGSSTSQSFTLALDPTKTTFSYTTSGTDATVTGTVAIAGPAYGVVNGKVTVTTDPGAGQLTCSFDVGPSAQGGASSGSCTLHGVTPGQSHPVTVAYAGSATTASSQLNDKIVQPVLATTPSLAVSPATDAQGNPVKLTSITVAAPGATALTGKITVFDAPATYTPVAGDAKVPSGAKTLCSGIALLGTTGTFAPSSADLAKCSGVPLVGTSYLGISYPGDPQSAPSLSKPVTYQATPAPTQISMTASAGGSPLGQTVASGTPITLRAAVTYTSTGLSGQTVPGAQVTFEEDGGTVVCANSTSLTCDVTPLYKDGSAHTYFAVFTGSTTANLAQASGPSNSVPVNVTAPASSLTFSAVTSPIPAGQSETLTVTFSSADPQSGTIGRISFFDASNKTTALPGCGALALTSIGGKLQASCAVTPPPGTSVGYFAKYTGDPNTGEVDTQTTPTVTAGPSGSTTVLDDIAGAVFGSPVALSATVTSAATTPRAQPVGYVSFTVSGTELCRSNTSAVGGGTASAGCSTSGLAGGTSTVVATFVPTQGTTAGSVSASKTVAVSRKSTTTTVSAAVNSATTASISLTVSGGLATAPTGTVDVTVAKDGGLPTAVNGCQGLPLTAGAAACQPDLPTAPGTYTYAAAYGGDTDFSASSGTADLQVQNGNIQCSNGFKALHDKIVAQNGALQVSNKYLTLTGTTTNASAGDCTAATVIGFSVTATLFSAVTGTVTGTITQSGGLCVNDGTLQGTSLAAYLKGSFGVTASICFALDSTTGIPGGVLSGRVGRRRRSDSAAGRHQRPGHRRRQAGLRPLARRQQRRARHHHPARHRVRPDGDPGRDDPRERRPVGDADHVRDHAVRHGTRPDRHDQPGRRRGDLRGQRLAARTVQPRVRPRRHLLGRGRRAVERRPGPDRNGGHRGGRAGAHRRPARHHHVGQEVDHHPEHQWRPVDAGQRSVDQQGHLGDRVLRRRRLAGLELRLRRRRRHHTVRHLDHPGRSPADGRQGRTVVDRHLCQRWDGRSHPVDRRHGHG